MIPDTIPVLTVRQPWADLILRGVKTLEVRTWSTAYRGPLVIHAAAAPPPAWAVAHAAEWSDGRWTPPAHWALGCLVALVDLVAVTALDAAVADDADGDALEAAAMAPLYVGEDAQLWHVARPVALRPERMPGRLGLWSVDARLVVPT